MNDNTVEKGFACSLKHPYTPPKLVTYGPVAELTAGHGGTLLDETKNNPHGKL
jgi:hypothetical protein